MEFEPRWVSVPNLVGVLLGCDSASITQIRLNISGDMIERIVVCESVLQSASMVAIGLVAQDLTHRITNLEFKIQSAATKNVLVHGVLRQLPKYQYILNVHVDEVDAITPLFADVK